MDESDRPPTVTTTTSAAPESPSEADIGEWITVPLASIPGSVIRQKIESPWVPPTSFTFPSTGNGRQRRIFQREWLTSNPWLVWSRKKNGVFCKYYSIGFGRQRQNSSRQYMVHRPLEDFKNPLIKIKAHKEASYHTDAVIHIEEYFRQPDARTLPVDVAVAAQGTGNGLRIRQRIVKGVTSIVKAIITAVRLGLPLRGHEDNHAPVPVEDFYQLTDFRFGVLNALLCMMKDAGDAGLREHLEQSPANSLYVTDGPQDDLLNIIRIMIQEQIVKEVHASPFYSLLLDTTTDEGGLDQLSLILRYTMEDGEIREEFLEFIDASLPTTGEELTRVIMDRLKALGLDIRRLRGQGYDAGPNFFGHHIGVNGRISQLQPLAVSAKRGAVLREKAEKLNQKKNAVSTPCTTRWSELSSSTETFLELYHAIVQALGSIAGPSSIFQEEGTREDARLLLNRLLDFEAVLTAAIAEEFLGLTRTASDALQTRDSYEYVMAMRQIGTIQQTLSAWNTTLEQEDSVYHKAWTKATGLLQKYNIRPSNETGNINDTYDTMCNRVARPILTHMMNQLAVRFSKRSGVLSQMAFLIPSLLLKNRQDITGAASFSPVIDMYRTDLSSPEDFPSELTRWVNQSSYRSPTAHRSYVRPCKREIFVDDKRAFGFVKKTVIKETMDQNPEWKELQQQCERFLDELDNEQQTGASGAQLDNAEDGDDPITADELPLEDSIRTGQLDGAACGFIAAGAVALLHNAELPFAEVSDDEIAGVSTRSVVINGRSFMGLGARSTRWLSSTEVIRLAANRMNINMSYAIQNLVNVGRTQHFVDHMFPMHSLLLRETGGTRYYVLNTDSIGNSWHWYVVAVTYGPNLGVIKDPRRAIKELSIKSVDTAISESSYLAAGGASAILVVLFLVTVFLIKRRRRSAREVPNVGRNNIPMESEPLGLLNNNIV
ncbi:hypothetical protein RvY_14182 [Ramazzottius varieornatus]|uniref:DUF4371 domain-containing protein n=1 Tax=Ramazzottius varieornatus TaxID=947166 RepID=A0A1D1VU98_RAMVA|nr:hypothetical protein RvY_14182 [Ramazzottius varieornatus]